MLCAQSNRFFAYRSIADGFVCWLYARRHGGQFVLPIEDTDPAGCVRWYGIPAHRRLPLTHVENCADLFAKAAADPRPIGKTFTVVDGPGEKFGPMSETT